MQRAGLSILFLGLVLSGLAGIINQVVWQRAVKLFLGGSETLSAMVVVIVFLGGLGLGAALAGRRVGGLKNPLLGLGLIELGLAGVNLVVTLILSLDLSASVSAAQGLASAAGLPMRAVYALATSVLLLPPTLMMGATVPLAGAACQRQLGAKGDALIPVLLFVNTVGAALGAWSASALLLPWWGQRAALAVAIGCNGLAGLLCLLISRGRATDPAASPAVNAPRRAGLGLGLEEGLGFALGALSLSYEMLLIRALTLSFEPLPETFAATLSGFLVAWSLGVALAGVVRAPVAAAAGLTGVLLAAMPAVHTAIRDSGAWSLWSAAAALSVPCLGFGLLYGGLARLVSVDWGRDLGRYGAANTLGSCAGVLGFTLIGFEAPLFQGALCLALGLFAVAWASLRTVSGRVWAGAVGLVSLAVLAWGLQLRTTTHNDEVAWWGRDGVVELTPDGDVYIDGLWHTRLSHGGDHIGEPYAWLMAAAALIGRGDRPTDEALVIGAGIGVSSVTLAGADGLSVDGYEINETLKRLLEDRPEETLGSLRHPALRWLWTDARAGLALNPKRYDLILSAPLHLRAAGSSSLLSLEYLDLVKSRLTEDGVLVVYANEGRAAQSLLVQRTLAERFRYRVTWYEGMITVASDAPFTLTEEWLKARMAKGDRFGRECLRFDRTLRLRGQKLGMFGLYEGEARAAEVADRPITDDHPLLEYPDVAEQLVSAVSVAQVPGR
ncbi:MAG: hypothetical protein JNM72_20845 [Deltaproteobacteria bacterium]|nr:hypothetical protein [Deltaproteobacteria bacterium]